LLAIDIETYSSIDITKCGVYAYTEAEDFEILLFAKRCIITMSLLSSYKWQLDIIGCSAS